FELLNVRPAFLVGKPLTLFVVADQRPHFWTQLGHLRETDLSESWELRLCPRDGVPVEVSCRVAAIRNAAGALVGLRWLIRDVTPSKRAGRLAAIGLTVAGMAHESRNALQRTQATAERLTWKLQGQPENLELVMRIQEAQNDLQRLFENVRGYAAPLR